MEAKVLHKLPCSTRIDSEKFVTKLSGCVRLSSREMREKKRIQVLISTRMQPNNIALNRHRSDSVKASCTYKNFPGGYPSVLESGNPHDPFDEAVILQNKSQEIKPYLKGRCIYFVGMMGSGKTTVGKVLSGELGYSFFDSDTLVEQSLDGTSVADIFKLYGEGFFRDKESEALRKLSLMHRLVVSTGGGAVTRHINWRYMQKGISVWLDVPLEALAQRIAAVGTDSRPLLHYSESADTYTEALNRLSVLFEERGGAYAKANARVSLKNLAAKMGIRDISSLTPVTIAIEALEQIEGYLNEDSGIAG